MDILQEKWDDILYTVKSEHELSDMSFKTWLKTLEILSISDHKVSFLVPTGQMGIDYITKKYLIPLNVAIAEVTGTEKPMPANVDLYSGFVYDALDIPITIATPLFATARLSGWCAHRIEEIVAGRKLMRPAYKSVQEPREYISMKHRHSSHATKK